MLVSDQGGRSNILAELERVGIGSDKDDARVGRVLDEVKRKEAEGFAFEGADASFYVLVKRVLGEVPRLSSTSSASSVSVERRYNALGELSAVAEAIVKVRVGDEVLISAAEGNGPVNALDVALRKDLGKYQDLIQDLELVDYKVRIYPGRHRRRDAGPDRVRRRLGRALVRPIGVSPNIIDASFQALTDSITYKLSARRRRDGVERPSIRSTKRDHAAIAQSVKRIVFSLQTSELVDLDERLPSRTSPAPRPCSPDLRQLDTILALAREGFDNSRSCPRRPVTRRLQRRRAW